MVVEPLDRLRAGGEGVGLQGIVEEGRVLFPDFIGLADSREAALVVVDHLKDVGI
jgi:hypothetical protein